MLLEESKQSNNATAATEEAEEREIHENSIPRNESDPRNIIRGTYTPSPPSAILKLLARRYIQSSINVGARARVALRWWEAYGWASRAEALSVFLSRLSLSFPLQQPALPPPRWRPLSRPAARSWRVGMCGEGGEWG